jgi:hypothetical protein
VVLSGLERCFPLETVSGLAPVVLFVVEARHCHLGVKGCHYLLAVKGCHYHLGDSNKRIEQRMISTNT